MDTQKECRKKLSISGDTLNKSPNQTIETK